MMPLRLLLMPGKQNQAGVGLWGSVHARAEREGIQRA